MYLQRRWAEFPLLSPFRLAAAFSARYAGRGRHRPKRARPQGSRLSSLRWEHGCTSKSFARSVSDTVEVPANLKVKVSGLTHAWRQAIDENMSERSSAGCRREDTTRQSQSPATMGSRARVRWRQDAARAARRCNERLRQSA